MTSREIRSSFLRFFEDRGHAIVPSAPVIPHGDPTLLFTNAGMNQFKDVFLGTGRRNYTRAADTQKCIRVSGKHNDLEEVGRDTYHHTFFEMLGNWSFGDYYKTEAIAWAWQLLTEVWGLDKKRLYATVFETDDEAEKIWKSVTDIHPSHVQRFGRKDNFWEMGETGPCGPCSEIHIDLTSDGSGAALVNAGNPEVMEIWNLVFIQHNRNDRGELEDLPAKHVDTGMGFERICAVLQGKRSNYDTDIFTPLINAIAEATGTTYAREEHRVAMRVIADHVRMLTFAIADGAIPSNEGRGYVLRRILRRAARFGRTLGMRKPFIHTIAPAVIANMGDVFPEIVDKRAHIEKVIRSEEEGFHQTLDRGLEIFESVVERIGHATVFPGGDAFRLYDTYGFPIDLTEMMAEERGLKVDLGEFTALMESQRERSRKGGGFQTSVAENPAEQVSTGGLTTRFTGYTALETRATILLASGNHVVIDATPFYVESGGQVSDTGVLIVNGKSLPVVGTRKENGTHVLTMQQDVHLPAGIEAVAVVDRARRLNVQRNHTATHLVHEALRRVLGTHVHQQGSLVAPDRLRFDFPHFGRITGEELRSIEDMVNEKIAEDIEVVTEADIPIDKARNIPNVKMFFGDKYGDIVRVVFVDERFSVEFCGGTHVKSTRDIGYFKIISEGSIASGIRRLEAVTGEGIIAYLNDQMRRIQENDERIARLAEERDGLMKALGLAVPPPRHGRMSEITVAPDSPAAAFRDAGTRIGEGEQHIDVLNREIADLRKNLARKQVEGQSHAIEHLVASAALLHDFRFVSARTEAGDMEQLKSLGDTLRQQLGSGVGILAAVIEGKIAFVCVVTDDLITTRKLEAGKIVGAVAREAGGGGGGKAHLATAGGRDLARLDSALTRARDIVASMLST